MACDSACTCRRRGECWKGILAYWSGRNSHLPEEGFALRELDQTVRPCPIAWSLDARRGVPLSSPDVNPPENTGKQALSGSFPLLITTQTSPWYTTRPPPAGRDAMESTISGRAGGPQESAQPADPWHGASTAGESSTNSQRPWCRHTQPSDNTVLSLRLERRVILYLGCGQANDRVGGVAPLSASEVPDRCRLSHETLASLTLYAAPLGYLVAGCGDRTKPRIYSRCLLFEFGLPGFAG